MKLAHKGETFDFKMMGELQERLLRSIKTESINIGSPVLAREDPVANPKELEKQVQRILERYPHAFTDAVTSWRTALYNNAMRALNEGGSVSTLSCPRKPSIDAQTLKEAISLLQYDVEEQGPSFRGVVRKSERVIRAAFADAVHRIIGVVSLRAPQDPERLSILEESTCLLDRARVAGCGGSLTTLEECLVTFDDDHVFHARARHLIDRLRDKKIDAMTKNSSQVIFSAAQDAESASLSAAVLADRALSHMGPYSGERALSVLLALRMGCEEVT